MRYASTIQVDKLRKSNLPSCLSPTLTDNRDEIPSPFLRAAKQHVDQKYLMAARSSPGTQIVRQFEPVRLFAQLKGQSRERRASNDKQSYDRRLRNYCINRSLRTPDILNDYSPGRGGFVGYFS